MEIIRHFRKENIAFAHPTQTLYVHSKDTSTLQHLASSEATKEATKIPAEV
jgi:hypothetical protein